LVEQALYFAIGFLTAALAAVVGLPLVSRRAMRIALARAQLQAPTSEREAIAERDAVRAQHAVDAVRLERRVKRAEDAAIGLRATLGVKSVKVLALEDELAESLRIGADQREEIGRLSAEGRDLAAELGAIRIALHDAFAQRDRAADAEAAALAQKSELEAEADRDRARIAILAARAESLQAVRQEMGRSTKAAAEAEGALAAQSGRAIELGNRLRETTSRSERLLEAQAQAEAAQTQVRRRIADLEARLAASEKAREETMIENARRLGAIAEREAELEKARAELAALKAGRSGAVAPADAQASRRENEELRGKIAELSVLAGQRADDAALRNAIKRLGREVARVFAAQKSSREPVGEGSQRSASEPEPASKPAIEAQEGLSEAGSPRLARTRAPGR